MSAMQIELTEHTPTCLPAEALTSADGEQLWRRYGHKLQVEFPSPKTEHQWVLTPRAWVGHLPLGPELGIRLRPRVPLVNLFRMLEYAYRLKSFQFLEDLTDCTVVDDVFERLAGVLAKRVLERGRRGFYRDYLSRSENLPVVRGRLDIARASRTPWRVALPCRYQEHTLDLEDNRLLVWTLFGIARSGLCRPDRALPHVRRAFRALQGRVSLQPYRPHDCVGRTYHRLNEDYQPMHLLCRFFLEYLGPDATAGEQQSLPFLVNMERLYELFVAQWLRAHLPAHYALRAQERVYLGDDKHLHFTLDLVLYEQRSGQPLCVLDTKYRPAAEPKADEVAQVVAYATQKGCREAVLVFPVPLTRPLNHHVGAVRVRSMSFVLDDDLEASGQALLADLLMPPSAA